jgi:hypothetical protein
MARMCILLGAPSAKPDSPLESVYVGRDASAMDAAAKASPFAVHYIVKNPNFIRKHNPLAVANAAVAAKSGKRGKGRGKPAESVSLSAATSVTKDVEGDGVAKDPVTETSNQAPASPPPADPPAESEDADDGAGHFNT